MRFLPLFYGYVVITFSVSNDSNDIVKCNKVLSNRPLLRVRCDKGHQHWQMFTYVLYIVTLSYSLCTDPNHIEYVSFTTIIRNLC
jgi:hypothetical protein